MAKAAAAGGKKGGKGGKGGAGGAADSKDNAGEHGLGVIPINYLKDGKDPSVLPDEEYPDWLWNMQVRTWILSCSRLGMPYFSFSLAGGGGNVLRSRNQGRRDRSS